MFFFLFNHYRTHLAHSSISSSIVLPDVGPEMTGTGTQSMRSLFLHTPIQRINAMMSSIWYAGWMKSPAWGKILSYLLDSTAKHTYLTFRLF